MKGTKQFYKKLWFWVFLVVAIIWVPLAINELYKCDKGYLTVWDGSDVLAYYGSLFGAVATIVALVATICFTINNQKKERKLSVRPYLQTKNKRIESYPDKAFDGEVTFVCMENGVVTTDNKLPREIALLKKAWNQYKSNGKKFGFYELQLANSLTAFFNSNYVFEYEVENYGSNTAIDIGLNLNGMCLLPKFCIRTNEKKRFVFIINKNATFKFLNIVFEYYDIHSLGKYKQKESFFLDELEDGLYVVQLNDNLLTSPEEITEV